MTSVDDAFRFSLVPADVGKRIHDVLLFYKILFVVVYLFVVQ